MVKQIGKGALFYNDATPQRVSADPLKPPRSRADTARAQLGAWVRGIWGSLIQKLEHRDAVKQWFVATFGQLKAHCEMAQAHAREDA